MDLARVAASLAICLGALAAVSAESRADNILIENVGATAWKSGGNSGSPLTVLVKKGDVIEVKVTGPHGFVSIDQPGNVQPDDTPLSLKHFQACGEPTKPTAMFQEIECSRFNKTLTPSMKFRVLDTFQGEVHFWCTVHKSGMWGTFKPRP
jgi:hypothetical protein